MTPRTPFSMPRHLGSLLVLLVAVGVVSAMFGGEERLDLTRTSHGVVPHAWGAAFTLLSELDLGARRSRTRLPERTPRQTQWLLAPQWSFADLDDRIAQVRAYAEEGGTVVLFGVEREVLEPLGLRASLGEPAVTPTQPTDSQAVDAPQDADEAAAEQAQDDDDDVHEFGTHAETAREFAAPMLGDSRFIVVEPDALFDRLGSEARAVVGAEDAALVVERSVGQGRVVAVASARFLDNAHLAEYGHAPFAVDLVRHYGPPIFDEHCHGLLPVGSVAAALGVGWVWLAALCWGALTLAALLHVRRWPAPRVDAGLPPPPTLDVFVGSLAALYEQSGRRHPDEVFRAYREGYLRRLQGAEPMPRARFDAQLERQAELLEPTDRGYLLGVSVPRDKTQLLRAVHALEQHAARTRQRSA